MEPIEITIRIHVNRGGVVSVITEPNTKLVKDIAIPPIQTVIKTVLECRYFKVGHDDKKSNTCVGCNVSCPVHGIYKGEPMSI